MAELHDQDQKKADVAKIQAGICPECNADLNDDGDPSGHAEMHWPVKALKPDTDAARRKKLVTNFHARRDALKQGS